MSIWQMPNGIYELNGKTALELELNKRKLIDNYLQNNYQLVLPPPINFANNNTVDSFKFSDTGSNKTLEIVADITSQVAIIDDKNNNNKVSKYCYCSQIIKPFADDFYSSRMPMQVGCEIYGDSSLDADYEIVEAMIQSLNTLKIKNINITISNISVFTNVIKYLKLEHFKQQLMQIITHRSTPDLLDFISQNKIKEKQELLSLINNDQDYIHANFANSEAVITQLKKVFSLYSKLKNSNINANFSIDLSDNKSYHYHNGLLFSAYSDGFSKAIARGGRYDNFLSDRYATGFSFDLNFVTLKK